MCIYCIFPDISQPPISQSQFQDLDFSPVYTAARTSQQYSESRCPQEEGVVIFSLDDKYCMIAENHFRGSCNTYTCGVQIPGYKSSPVFLLDVLSHERLTSNRENTVYAEYIIKCNLTSHMHCKAETCSARVTNATVDSGGVSN